MLNHEMKFFGLAYGSSRTRDQGEEKVTRDEFYRRASVAARDHTRAHAGIFQQNKELSFTISFLSVFPFIRSRLFPAFVGIGS